MRETQDRGPVMSRNGTLCVDIGNTNTVFGVICNGKVEQQWRIETNTARMPDEYGLIISGLLGLEGISRHDLEGIAISSVVPSLTSDFAKLSLRYFGIEPLVVGPDTETGLKILYDDPRQVGADRIVNAVSVKERFGGPACIVDFGTATTFDALDAESAYLGGAIAPGLIISAEALFSRAARLSRVRLSPPTRAVGRNTEESVQSGIILGYASLVEGLVERFRKELGEEMRVIATGGLAGMVAAETDSIGMVDPELTLDGLYRIYRRNVGR